MLDYITLSTFVCMSALMEHSTATMLTQLLSNANPDKISDVGLKYVGAGLTGVGMIGAGIGQGFVGAGACVAVGRNPEVSKKVMQIMFIIAGFAESGAIYALLIAVILMFVF